MQLKKCKMTTCDVISYSMLQLNKTKSKTFQVDLLKIWHIKRTPVHCNLCGNLLTSFECKRMVNNDDKQVFIKKRENKHLIEVPHKVSLLSCVLFSFKQLQQYRTVEENEIHHHSLGVIGSHNTLTLDYRIVAIR